jgi:hypothetical protein
MITEFCMHCGAKFQYSLNKPKFCSSCGSSLGEKSEASAPEATQQKEEKENNELPNLSKLEYSINESSHRQTFGDLVSEASRSQSSEYEKAPNRPKPKYDPSEDVIQSAMQQCRSKREPEDLGGQES